MKMENKFKFGDWVRVIDNEHSKYGEKGIVIKEKGCSCKVAFEFGRVWLAEEQLELLPKEEKVYDYTFGNPPYINEELNDAVNHPSHYTSDPSGVECIEIVKHRDFCTGNAMKYLWRAGLKHDADKTDKEKQIEDLKKAVWYINKEIELLEGKQCASD